MQTNTQQSEVIQPIFNWHCTTTKTSNDCDMAAMPMAMGGMILIMMTFMFLVCVIAVLKKPIIKF